MTSTSNNLMQTILADADLRQRLTQLPSDAKTVSLSLQGNWSTAGRTERSAVPAVAADTPASPSETVLLSVSAETRRSIQEQSVPTRRVTMVGKAGAKDGEYRLVGKLGSGGTGIVYQAHQRAVDREVAVKVLRHELAVDPQSRERFLTEARVIGGLDHPNVIALHELCVDEDGGLFYSMKRVDGASWNHRIGSMSLDENLQVLLRVADAIRYAHSRGLIHRDIKPENVMLGQYGEVLLADWGLAVSKNPHQFNIESNQDHAIGGTPAYMAPELATGDQSAVTYRTDVYLLGAILFQILTGNPPHHGENLLQCIHAAANNIIRPTKVEGDLMDIAMKAMSTRPADRFESVDRFIAALEDQRVHQQSVLLVQRAQRRLREASSGEGYESFRVADALLREAIEVWPENRRAHEAILELQRSFASAAASQGDLDLALSLYEAAGEGQSEVASRIRRARDQRNDHARGEAKYSILFTQSPEAGLLTRLSDGMVLEANEAFGRLLGYANDAIVGRLMGELNVWACPQRRVAFVTDARRDGMIDNFEADFLDRNGRRIEVLISARTLNVSGTKILMATIRDISLRKQAERDLKRSRQRLRDLQRLAGLGTWSFDVLTGEIQWSEEIYRLVGRDVSEGTLRYEDYLKTIHPEDRERLRLVVDDAIKNGKPYELVLRQGSAAEALSDIPVRGRKYRSVIARGQPLLDVTDKVVEIYGVMIAVKENVTAPADRRETSTAPDGSIA